MPYARCGCYYERGKFMLHTIDCILRQSSQREALETNWRRLPMGDPEDELATQDDVPPMPELADEDVTQQGVNVEPNVTPGAAPPEDVALAQAREAERAAESQND